MADHAQYKDPAGGTPSSIGPQLADFYYQKKALIEMKKEQFFGQLADVTAMPKNFGKTMKRFHYLPLLDDRNINDQGIDANGATIANGNLYGTSKDVGTISGKLPALTENGGRVNRVGFKRIQLEGSISKFGFFDEYTQESLDFDSDSELMEHINREMLMGANEMTEDALQIDLLNGAGVIYYPGSATQDSEISGNSGAVTLVTYEDIMKLNIELTNNRTPKTTKLITGSRLIDTKTIDAARYLYVGSEMLPTLRRMKDLHNNPAFIPVQQYAAAGNVAVGEIGSIDQFRIIEVPEMMHWEGVGAAVTTNGGYRETSNNYDVFPLLVVGSGSFTTIGFQTDGKSVKFAITHKKPGKETADRNDPYGETGFMSIKWYYGSMILRPERIGLIKSVAEI
jgi:N4-gp56 family major capsid protein